MRDAETGLRPRADARVLVTQKIKALADVRPIAIDDADSIIRAFRLNMHSNEEQLLLPNLTAKEQAKIQEGREGDYEWGQGVGEWWEGKRGRWAMSVRSTWSRRAGLRSLLEGPDDRSSLISPKKLRM